MSKRNGRVHINVLCPSTLDDIELCRAVQERFLNVIELYIQVNKEPLVPPPSMNKDMIRWRQMAVRHRQEDYRHTEAEKKSLQAIAQWTLDENCKLRNQPFQKLRWKDD